MVQQLWGSDLLPSIALGMIVCWPPLWHPRGTAVGFAIPTRSCCALPFWRSWGLSISNIVSSADFLAVACWSMARLLCVEYAGTPASNRAKA